MSSYSYSGQMKVPLRSAPLPPTSSSWSSSIFAPRDKNAAVNNKTNLPKKKPPPRPPPPKFNQQRPTEVRGSLVGGLFPQRTQSRPIYEPVSSLANTGCLIDWTSPPSSPTSTTRSSSDALSVNSFGSDSIAPSSGNASNVESGFEDDFELFGAPTTRAIDPWKSPPVNAPAPVKSSWVSFSPTAPKKLSMPTIIRAKPERPKPPKILEKKLEMDALAQVFENAKLSGAVQDDEEDDWECDSPPMPTMAPPAPPPEVLAELLSQRPEVKTVKSETGVALFDYEGAPGDLSFRQGDRIRIIRRIDENWFQAELAGRQGSAPANFLQVESADPRVVSALYAFNPESWEDLALEPGLQVRLLGRVDDSWLFGEANGRRGQLPANFVDHVPLDLPQWKS